MILHETPNMRTILIPLLLFYCLALPGQQKENTANVIPIYKELLKQLESKDASEAIDPYRSKMERLENGELLPSTFLPEMVQDIFQLYSRYGDFKGSEHLLLKLLKLLNKNKSTKGEFLAGLNHKIAVLYIEKRDYNTANDYLEKAKKLWINNSITIPMAYYTSLGNIHVSLGITEKALEYFQEALHIAKTTLGERSIPVLISYYNIANCLMDLKAYEESLEYLDKTLKIGSQIMGKNHPQLAQTYVLMGQIHTRRKEYDKALTFLKKTENIYNNSLSKTHPKLFHLYLSLGELYFAKEEYDKAHICFQKILDIQKEIYGEYSPTTSFVYYEMGRNFAKQGAFQRSFESFERALNSNSISFKDGKARKFQENVYDISLYMASSMELAASIFEEAKICNDEGKLKIAQMQYSKVDSIVDFYRQDVHNVRDKINVTETYHEVYFKAMQSYLIEHEKTKDPNALREAFRFSEKGRFNTMREALNQSEAKHFSEIPDQLIALDTDLNIDKAFLQSKKIELLYQKPIDSTVLSQNEKQLFSISLKQDSLRKVIEEEYPKYYQLKYQHKVISLDELQKNLDTQTTFLEYYHNEKTTYVFLISREKRTVKKLNTPSLSQDIADYRKSLLEKNTEAYKKLAHSLYSQLLAPFENELKGENLIIVPDGPLWHLNFDLLLSKYDKTNNPKNLPYLLRKYAITYANSGSVVFKPSESVERIEKPQECLAFSYSNSTQLPHGNTINLAKLRDTEEDLPGTRKEIRNIADILDGQYFFGTDANEANFKKNASKYGLLHLALHGKVDNEQPKNSRLLFTKSNASDEDNSLYIHELYALNIPSEIAVLSACDTGTGKMAKGEGIMSIGNAFQYAGTKSIMLSSWEVADDVSPLLMRFFYTNLKKGMNKGKALQQAKLMYLNSAKSNSLDPFFWGSFYIVGNNDAIFQQSHYQLYLFIILFMALIVVSFLTYKKVIKKKH